MEPVRWLGLIRNVNALEAGVEDVLGRRELVALRPVPWLQDLVSVDRFAGYDPQEWVFEVAFLLEAATSRPATSRGWSTLQRIARRS